MVVRDSRMSMNSPHSSGSSLAIKVLIGLVLIAAAAMFLLPAIPQDPGYHNFADSRTILGVPNFWNVASNILFLPLGVLGFFALAAEHWNKEASALRSACGIFFLGFMLVGFGSGWYHLNPGNDTLLWDRLPMSIAFMAFFSFIIGASVSVVWGHRLLWPLLIIGAGSVFYWYFTELAGKGDLRWYALVQFLPMLLIPYILWKFESTLFRSRYVWAMLGFYLASKLAEWQDAAIYSILQVISGHSLKHVLAAMAGLMFYRALMESKHNSDLNNPHG